MKLPFFCERTAFAFFFYTMSSVLQSRSLAEWYSRRYHYTIENIDTLGICCLFYTINV